MSAEPFDHLCYEAYQAFREGRDDDGYNLISRWHELKKQTPPPEPPPRG